MVAGTRGDGDLLPSWQGRVVGTLAGVWAELGLALRSIVICCDLSFNFETLDLFCVTECQLLQKGNL